MMLWGAGENGGVNLRIPQGMIRLDSEFAKELSFTSGFFKEGSYLWGDGNRVVVSLIESRNPGQGAFRTFLRTCDRLGIIIVVPSPLPRMMAILQHYGFVETWESDDVFGEVDVWIKEGA
jgi:hypothetical protein